MTTPSFKSYRPLVLLFWFLALLTIPIWGHLQAMPPGWDLHVYAQAIHSLRLGHDPYLDGIAVQRAFHQTAAALNPDIMPPYTYVYSPLTLPLVARLGDLSTRLTIPAYWLLYVLAMIATALVGAALAEENEKKLFALLAPAAMFFPGLLQDGVIFSGNIAYVLYGFTFATALLGWRRNNWLWFYLAVLAASCFKAPLLTLLAIPILSARKQWLSTALTAAAGTALFLIQPVLWPSTFHNYLEAIELQFSFNHDFGLSPAALVGNLLYYNHLPYSPGTTIAYLVYAIPLFGMLAYLSRRYFAGVFTLEQWAPVLLIGVILLNPRIKEYDVAPIALPMAFILWRFFACNRTIKQTAIVTGLLFAAINIVAMIWSGPAWRPEECILLVTLFSLGCWDLLASPARTQSQTAHQATDYRLSLAS